MAKEVKLTNKKRIWILRIITAFASIVAVIAPVVTNKVNKDHEEDKLKEQHAQDLRKSRQEFAQNSYGFQKMIDKLEQQIKIKDEELDIAKGIHGTLSNDVLVLRSENEKLKKRVTASKEYLSFLYS